MDRWEAEGRPFTTEGASYPADALTPRPRPGLFVGKKEMLAAIGDGAVCSLNALDAALHSGENPRYGRPGRIPGSNNVPAPSLLDPATKAFLPPETAARAFHLAGAMPVYDASMSEWAKDETLPIESDVLAPSR
jgi:thiosulfate/3-mercaptopyruvate sulfurtransferase